MRSLLIAAALFMTLSCVAQETGRYFAAIWPEGCQRNPRESCWTYAYLPDGWSVEKATDGPSWAYRILAAPGTNIDANTLQVLPGSGLQVTTPFEGGPMRLEMDITYLLHVAGTGTENQPIERAPCYNGFGVWLSQDAVFVCAPSSSWPQDGSPWMWRRVTWSIP